MRHMTKDIRPVAKDVNKRGLCSARVVYVDISSTLRILSFYSELPQIS